VADDTELKEDSCNCESWQRTSAALAAVWFTVHMDVFQITQDESTAPENETDLDLCEPYTDTRSFYTSCGSRIKYIGNDRQEVKNITTCTLDNFDNFAPVADVFTQKKLAWMKHFT